MGNRVGGGARVPLGGTGTTTFTAPSGMTIADFTLTRQLTYRNGAPADGTRRLYAIYKLGSTVFAGAGHYDNATRNRLTPRAAGTATRRATSSCRGAPSRARASPRSPATPAPPPRCRSRSAASTARVNTACTVGRERRHLAPDLRRPGRPQRPHRARAPSVEASGLLAGGRRAGSDPVTLDASDNGGIRRVEIVDVSAAAARRRRRGLQRPARAPRRGATCSFRLAQGVPEPPRRDGAADEPGGRPADAHGPRRSTPAATSTERARIEVDVVTPSDRGAAQRHRRDRGRAR